MFSEVSRSILVKFLDPYWGFSLLVSPVLLSKYLMNSIETSIESLLAGCIKIRSAGLVYVTCLVVVLAEALLFLVQCFLSDTPYRISITIMIDALSIRTARTTHGA